MSFNPVPGKAEAGSQSNFEKLMSCLTLEKEFMILIGFKECVKNNW
jgi:hypothetical protein